MSTLRVFVSPTEIGVPAFNLKFDLVFRSVSTRLRRYDSQDACGQWNGRLIEDFRSDVKFIRTADELFGAVVEQQTNGECIASDGVSLETVMIDFGAAIDLHFRLNFFSMLRMVTVSLLQNSLSRSTPLEMTTRAQRLVVDCVNLTEIFGTQTRNE